MAQWGTDKSKLATNKLSKEILHASAIKVIWRQLTKKQPEFGKEQGETVQILRTSHPTDAAVIGLSETQITPSTSIALNTTTVTIKEYTSRKIPLTERMKLLSPYDLMDLYVEGMTNNLAEGMDMDCANAFTACKIKAIPTGTAAAPSVTFDTDGTPSTAATRNAASYDIRRIARAMEGTYLIPPYGNRYRCVMTPGFKFSIFGDAEYWETANKTDLLNNYLTSQYGVDFISSNNSLITNFGDNIGSSSYEGEAVFCGIDPVREIMVMPEHLREGEMTDFKRSYGIAMFAYAAYGEVWPVATAREVKIIHFTAS